MKSRQTYQQILGMVIGLSVLSYISRQPYISYFALSIGFLSIASERFARAWVHYTHKILVAVFGFILKLILGVIYYVIITPIGIIKRKEKKHEGWQGISRKEDPEQMKYTW